VDDMVFLLLFLVSLHFPIHRHHHHLPPQLVVLEYLQAGYIIITICKKNIVYRIMKNKCLTNREKINNEIKNEIFKYKIL